MPIIVLYTACWILGAAGALLIAHFGNMWGFTDIPNSRSSHRHPIPKGGGVGILSSFLLSAVCLKILPGLWVPVVVLALVSLLGDRYDLSPRFRLIVQFGAAFMVLVTGVLAEKMVLLGSFSNSLSALLGIGCLMIFMVGTANYYNFMDGINGIASITGMVSFALLAFFATTLGKEVIASVCLCLVLACFGFLPFNIPRAKVFMGDVGSILLGFVFAGMVVFLSRNWQDFVCLAACLFPFYADELTTMVVRLRDGERLSTPHRKHLYQLLANEMGIAHWKISLGYGLFQLIVGSSAIAMSTYGFISIFGMFCFYSMIFAVVSFQVRRYVCHKL